MQKLLDLAKSQTGYQEKNSASYLDDFKKNAGYGNYTRYSRDVERWGLNGCQAQPWCATYQFWLEAQIFGVEGALNNFHMTRRDYQGYNCFAIYDAFSKAGRVSSKPQRGCLVIFKHSHIGRVVQIGNGRIYTNEGNTSALYGDRNGGTVKEKDYGLKDSSIKGYCIMDYEDKDTAATPTNPDMPSQGMGLGKVESFQKWLNIWYPQILETYCNGLLEEDNQYGKKTRNGALAVWKDVCNRKYQYDLNPGNTNFGEKSLKAAQKAVIRSGDGGTFTALAEGILAGKGYYRGNIDAQFGELMRAAVISFQKDKGLKVDGVIGKESWGALFS